MKTFNQIKRGLRKIAASRYACKPGLDMWEASESKVDLVKTIVAYYKWVMVDEEVISEKYLLENFTVDELAEGGLYYRDEDVKRLSDFWRESIQADGYHSFNSAKECCPEGYRLPTDEEFSILIANTQYSLENKHGIFEFKNGERLFFPVLGYYQYCSKTEFNVGFSGYYWSGHTCGIIGHSLNLNSSRPYLSNSSHTIGFSVRYIKE